MDWLDYEILELDELIEILDLDSLQDVIEEEFF